MASLADLLDPDQWILSGKSLVDFPWPEGNNEREAVKLAALPFILIQTDSGSPGSSAVDRTHGANSTPCAMPAQDEPFSKTDVP
jgi:hypothetical protein